MILDKFSVDKKRGNKIWAPQYSLVVPMRKIYRYFYGFVAAEGVKGNVGRGFYCEIGAGGRTWRRPGVALYRRFQVFEFELGASGRRKHVGCKILGFLPPPPPLFAFSRNLSYQPFLLYLLFGMRLRELAPSG